MISDLVHISVNLVRADREQEVQGMHTVWTNQPSSAENAFRCLFVTMYVVPLITPCRDQHIAFKTEH